MCVGASIARPPKIRDFRIKELWLFRIKTIQFPLNRVVFDVFPNDAIIIFIADHMVVKQFLPDESAELFCHISLHLLDHSRNRRGDHWSSVFVGVDLQKKMNVVRHHNIMVQSNRGIIVFDVLDRLLYDLSCMG